MKKIILSLLIVLVSMTSSLFAANQDTEFTQIKGTQDDYLITSNESNFVYSYSDINFELSKNSLLIIKDHTSNHPAFILIEGELIINTSDNLIRPISVKTTTAEYKLNKAADFYLYSTEDNELAITGPNSSKVLGKDFLYNHNFIIDSNSYADILNAYYNIPNNTNFDYVNTHNLKIGKYAYKIEATQYSTALEIPPYVKILELEDFVKFLNNNNPYISNYIEYSLDNNILTITYPKQSALQLDSAITYLEKSLAKYITNIRIPRPVTTLAAYCDTVIPQYNFIGSLEYKNISINYGNKDNIIDIEILHPNNQYFAKYVLNRIQAQYAPYFDDVEITVEDATLTIKFDEKLSKQLVFKYMQVIADEIEAILTGAKAPLTVPKFIDTTTTIVKQDLNAILVGEFELEEYNIIPFSISHSTINLSCPDALTQKSVDKIASSLSKYLNENNYKHSYSTLNKELFIKFNNDLNKEIYKEEIIPQIVNILKEEKKYPATPGALAGINAKAEFKRVSPILTTSIISQDSVLDLEVYEDYAKLDYPSFIPQTLIIHSLKGMSDYIKNISFKLTPDSIYFYFDFPMQSTDIKPFILMFAHELSYLISTPFIPFENTSLEQTTTATQYDLIIDAKYLHSKTGYEFDLKAYPNVITISYDSTLPETQIKCLFDTLLNNYKDYTQGVKVEILDDKIIITPPVILGTYELLPYVDILGKAIEQFLDSPIIPFVNNSLEQNTVEKISKIYEGEFVVLDQRIKCEYFSNNELVLNFTDRVIESSIDDITNTLVNNSGLTDLITQKRDGRTAYISFEKPILTKEILLSNIEYIMEVIEDNIKIEGSANFL